MKAINGYDSAETMGAGSASYDLPAGGYVCRILKVTDTPDRNYLVVEFDITEGQYKNYGTDTLERAGFNPCHFIRSYSERAVGFFKGFIKAIEESNPGYKWDWNEQGLVGKMIGLTIGVEHYTKRDGKHGTRPYVDRNTTTLAIREGRFKVPEPKGYAPDEPAASETTVTFDNGIGGELPF